MPATATHPEQAVRNLLDALTDAIGAKDLPRILAHYAEGVVSFDAIPPFVINGRAAFGESWAACLPYFPEAGTFRIERRGLSIHADEHVATAHWLQRFDCNDPAHPCGAGWLRMTALARKHDGRWRIVHEHCSAPFDPSTMKATMDLDATAAPHAGPSFDPDTGLQLRKLVRAPRQRVFEALTTAEQITQWWLPEGDGEHTATIDARVGGTFRVTMAEKGQRWEGLGTITTFEPPARFAYTWTWSNDPAYGGDSHVSFELRDAPNPYDDGPATEIILTHSNLLTAHVRSDFTGGWWDGLRALGYYVRGVDPREAMSPRK